MILVFRVLKMHGDYLAIVTLGFGEIIRLVLNNWLEFTGGPNGAPVSAPTLFDHGEVISDGTPQSVANDPAVIAAYRF